MRLVGFEGVDALAETGMLASELLERRGRSGLPSAVGGGGASSIATWRGHA